MKKKFGVLTIALIVSACVSHPAQYEPLSVSLKNNEPCFVIPIDSGLEEPITSHSPTIMKRTAGGWETVSPESTFSPVVRLNTQQCHQWSGIPWQPGEYDIALKVTGKNDSIRYAVRFVLEKNASGQFQVLQSE